jgi:hypothetical protein
MDLAIELQKIYDSEINIDIGWFWDGGITVRLGDQMNRYLAEENVNTVAPESDFPFLSRFRSFEIHRCREQGAR